MRALIQRTSGASVSVDGEVVGEIGSGLVIFVCAMRGDTEAESEWLARKVVKLRIFRDDEGRMNRSVQDVGGSALIVSQFTLAAETRGNRTDKQDLEEVAGENDPAAGTETFHGRDVHHLAVEIAPDRTRNTEATDQ